MNVHFIAIGGSTMHNLAIALHLKGYKVTGSDDEIFEPAKGRLQKYGILPASIGWFPEKINSDLDAIILGMHAREDNPELLKAKELGVKIYSFPEFLYEQSRNKKRIVIGGSHGKTTITSMILHVLNGLNFSFDYMVGAQLEGFEVMVKLSEEAPIIILEGDEYLTSPIDRRPKFWVYQPDIALISGIAWDHFNVFPTFDFYKEQFLKFADLVPENGALIYCDLDENVVEVAQKSVCNTKIPYSLPSFRIESNKTIVDFEGHQYPLSVFGNHNLMNIEAARNVCLLLGISNHDFYQTISTFGGASKRLEKIAETERFVAYKDFAHSPSKVKATIEAVKQQYPEKEVIAFFELHTYSSLNAAFLEQYKGAMDSADVPIVYFDHHALEIKKLPMLEPELVRAKFENSKILVMNKKEQISEFYKIAEKENKVFLFMSSGNFGGLSLVSLLE